MVPEVLTRFQVPAVDCIVMRFPAVPEKKILPVIVVVVPAVNMMVRVEVPVVAIEVNVLEPVNVSEPTPAPVFTVNGPNVRPPPSKVLTAPATPFTIRVPPVSLKVIPVEVAVFQTLPEVPLIVQLVDLLNLRVFELLEDTLPLSVTVNPPSSNVPLLRTKFPVEVVEKLSSIVYVPPGAVKVVVFGTLAAHLMVWLPRPTKVGPPETEVNPVKSALPVTAEVPVKLRVLPIEPEQVKSRHMNGIALELMFTPKA